MGNLYPCDTWKVLVGVVFLGGLILVVIGVVIQQKHAISTDEKLKEIEAKIPSPITVNGILAGLPKQAPPKGEERAVIDWREAFRNPQWQIVNDHVFANTSVDVDGKSFHRCSFKNVTLFFRGNAPVEFRETTTIDGTLVFATDNPAIHLYQSLQAQFASVPGAKVDAGAHDDKGRELQLPGLKVQFAEIIGVTYPIPELRLKVLSMVSELQGFLGEHGEDPTQPDIRKELGESDDEFLARHRARSLDETPRKWRAKLHGDYCLRFSDCIERLRNEIRLRASD